jgi:outer membrane protein OmpA-like peptidoglycan-associated protein
MVNTKRRFSIFGVFILAGLMALSGCATRKYVRLQTQALEPEIQEANNGVKTNAERIDTVDRRAQQALAAAGTADAKATAAQTAANDAANAAQSADRKADTANQGVQAANTRITTRETNVTNINPNDNYTAGETQTVTFASGKATLSDDAKSMLDKIASDAAGMGKGYMLQIQGFTDSAGSEDYNIGLSQRRAQSVQRYLVSKNIPLFRVSIVGLGEANPVADNHTKAGMAQNRRVEINVMKAAAGRQGN